MKYIATREEQISYFYQLLFMNFYLVTQETFDAGLQAFEKEGIQTITALKDQLVASNHAQTPAIEKRYNDVMDRYVLQSY